MAGIRWIRGGDGEYYIVHDEYEANVRRNGRDWYWHLYQRRADGAGGALVADGPAPTLARAKASVEAAVERRAGACGAPDGFGNPVKPGAHRVEVWARRPDVPARCRGVAGATEQEWAIGYAVRQAAGGPEGLVVAVVRLQRSADGTDECSTVAQARPEPGTADVVRVLLGP